MAPITIHIRPKEAYNYPNKILTTTVDTSARLEKVVTDLKLDTTKGLALFSSRGKNELALNSSLASNNIQPGDILETCSCPLLSTACSAVLADLNLVQQQIPHDDERTTQQERIRKLLDVEEHDRITSWSGRWSREDVQTRIICVAFLKKVMQRNDRFANVMVPSVDSLEEFHEFLQQQQQQHIFGTTSNGNNGGSYNSLLRLFKPISKKSGEPTTCWKLLQYKLDKISALLQVPTTSGIQEDAMERFLIAEKKRREGSTTPSTSRKVPPAYYDSHHQEAASPQQQQPKRKRRRLTLESPSRRLADKQWECRTCGDDETIINSKADCMCLTEPCPFFKSPLCRICFEANHPVRRRHHERIAFTDPRAKAVLKALHHQAREYCPEYASGPFALLCALSMQAEEQQHYSLTESELKEVAQPLCRSDLYDHQARGRSAFAGMEGLVGKNLVRKELLPGREQQEGKYSLLPEGEKLAKFCVAFENVVQSIVRDNPSMVHDRRGALRDVIQQQENEEEEEDVVLISPMAGGSTPGYPNSSGINPPISIIIDTREDQAYSNRLIRRCQIEAIPCEKRVLPAGDYLFTREELVCPLIIIERKTWSDLADSVCGQGRGPKRLDCIRIVGTEEDGRRRCENGRCQVCKMKASGCRKQMIIVEGPRCAKLDGFEGKCTNDKRCPPCRELQERNSIVTQEVLEGALYKLQVEHGFLVHYTRSFNETIESLLVIRAIILGANLPTTTRLSTFEQFSLNARRKPDTEHNMEDDARGQKNRGGLTINEWDDSVLVRPISEGRARAFFASMFEDPVHGASEGTSTKVTPSSEVINLYDEFLTEGSSSEVINLYDEFLAEEGSGRRAVKEARPPPRNASVDEVIILDNSEDETDDSQNSVKVIETQRRFETRSTPAKTRRRVVEGNLRGTNTSRKQPGLGPLVVITGLYEYDTESFKDLTEIWKSLYHLQNQTGLVPFRLRSRQELQKLQNGTVPIVDRNAILFWILYAQLKYDIRIHVLRDSACKSAIKKCWEGDAVPHLPVAATENNLSSATPQRSTSKVVSKPNPIPSCGICRESIGKTNVEATICGHAFHSSCLRRWLRAQPEDKRLCPICKHPTGIRFSDSDAVLESNPQPPRAPLRRAIVAESSSERERIRMARLAKFEENSTRRSAYHGSCERIRPNANVELVGQSCEGWECTCTLLNDEGSLVCEACGSSRVVELKWSCTLCTFENDGETSICSMCDTSKQASDNVSVIGSQLLGDRCCAVETPLAFRSAEDVYSASSLTSRTRTRISTPSVHVKCGACGKLGHNRGTANPENCDMYWDDKEIKLREKKKAASELKAKEVSEQLKQIERDEVEARRQNEEMKQLLARMEQRNVASEKMREIEKKRLDRAKKRAEKQLQKLR